jgi:gamma-glutamyl phosphate reductase
MAYKLSIDGGETFLELREMSDEQIKSAVDEIKDIADCDDDVREMLDGIHATNDRDLLSAIHELGDIEIDCRPYPRKRFID